MAPNCHTQDSFFSFYGLWRFYITKPISERLFTQADDKDSSNVGGGSGLILMAPKLVLRAYGGHNDVHSVEHVLVRISHW